MKSKCETLACSCARANIPCSEFCGCQQHGCSNKWNGPQETDDEEESDEEEEHAEEEDNQFCRCYSLIQFA